VNAIVNARATVTVIVSMSVNVIGIANRFGGVNER
jgi:hypothetical protein